MRRAVQADAAGGTEGQSLLVGDEQKVEKVVCKERSELAEKVQAVSVALRTRQREAFLQVPFRESRVQVGTRSQLVARIYGVNRSKRNGAEACEWVLLCRPKVERAKRPVVLVRVETVRGLKRRERERERIAKGVALYNSVGCNRSPQMLVLEASKLVR